jgi:hypothetical protein
MIQDKELLDFFQDIEFMPPNNRDPREFISQPEDIEEPGEFSHADIETGDHTDHPTPAVYSDYYMFTDPVARDGGLKNPKSKMANKLDKAYHNKNLADTHSFSDIHQEPLEQDAPQFPRHEKQPEVDAPVNPDGTFPKHSGVRSMMEPTVAFNIQQPQEIQLNQPTMIEGKVYDKGTKLSWREK